MDINYNDDKCLVEVASALAIAYAKRKRFENAYAVFNTVRWDIPSNDAYELGKLFQDGGELRLASDVFDSLTNREVKDIYVGLAAFALGLSNERLADEITDKKIYWSIYHDDLVVAESYYETALECGIPEAKEKIETIKAKLKR